MPKMDILYHAVLDSLKLGFRVYDIDCYFNSGVEATNRHEYVQDLLGSNVRDITKKIEFEEGIFDVVFLASVVEHINDLGAAFREALRSLKPGGVFVSTYGPFSSSIGSHSLEILDSPWAHV